MEIVILDSASSDNTRNLVLEYQSKIHGITYCYREKKMGIDIDMAKTVELAKGEYCWLLSSDDGLTPNAIKILFEEIKHKHEIYLCNRIVCDLYLSPIHDKSWLTKNISNNIFNLSIRDELLYYLESAIEFGAIFSYMSVLIFKRSEWNRVEYDKSFTGTGYAHVSRIFGIINNSGRLKYIESPLILNRSFNDSFLDMGIVKRFMLDIDGYSLLANNLFPHDITVKKQFLRVMVLEHPWYQIVKIRAYINNKIYWNDIKPKLLYCGYSEATLNIANLLAKVKWLVKLAVKSRYYYNMCFIHKPVYLFIRHINDIIKK
jgi:abequosyltransferase